MRKYFLIFLLILSYSVILSGETTLAPDDYYFQLATSAISNIENCNVDELRLAFSKTTYINFQQPTNEFLTIMLNLGGNIKADERNDLHIITKYLADLRFMWFACGFAYRHNDFDWSNKYANIFFVMLKKLQVNNRGQTIDNPLLCLSKDDYKIFCASNIYQVIDKQSQKYNGKIILFVKVKKKDESESVIYFDNTLVDQKL